MQHVSYKMCKHIHMSYTYIYKITYVLYSLDVFSLIIAKINLYFLNNQSCQTSVHIKPFALMNIWCIISLVKCLLRHLSISPFLLSILKLYFRTFPFSLLVALPCSSCALCTSSPCLSKLGKSKTFCLQSGKKMLSLSRSIKTKIT